MTIYTRCLILPILTIFIFSVLCLLTEIPDDIKRKMDIIEDTIIEPLQIYDDYCDISQFQTNMYNMILFNNMIYDIQNHYNRIILFVDVYICVFIILLIVSIFNIVVFIMSVF